MGINDKEKVDRVEEAYTKILAHNRKLFILVVVLVIIVIATAVVLGWVVGFYHAKEVAVNIASTFVRDNCICNINTNATSAIGQGIYFR